ncbi:putative Cpp50 domain protein (plasmid) [Clostridium botulinum]|uniref:Putative Cpp50 domain protein n=1 Tax=Clostridium botulinum TaxID=1491 RepID=A0A1L7JNL8_CLOBO|nr:putative Cpp50 domain protein [Clostridium botulinum]
MFLKLKLPKEYKLIKTKKSLIEEAVLNRNCVASYDDKINKGKSVIYTRIYKNKRYTIEIKRKLLKVNILFM